MLINSEIISRLTDDQKISIVTDLAAASSDAFTSLGIPRIESATLEHIFDEFGGDAMCPSVTGMARSWNPKLISQAIGDMLQRSGSEKYNLIFGPDMYLKTGTYATGMSEDPYLSAKLGGAAVSAIEDTGCAACLTGGSLRPIDADYADVKPDNAAVLNFYTRAFDTVMRNREPSAVRISCAKLKGAYKDVNTDILERNLSKNVVKTVLAESAFEEALRSGIGRERLLFIGSSPAAVRSALKNYKRMKDDVERGSISLEELKKAVDHGTAISPDTLDKAVDNAIEFLKKAARPRKHYTGETGKLSDYSKRQAYVAAQESIVLLKNTDNTLPIKGAMRIGVIGDILNEYPEHIQALRRALSSRDATYVGFAEGYRLEQDRSDELLTGAAALANDSDIIIAFVGLGSRRESKLAENKSVKLPANQLVALDTVARSGKKIVAVACGDVLPDMKFDGVCRATLAVPLGGSCTIGALFDILFGVVSPSGRLTASAYDDADEDTAMLHNAVRSGKQKMGEFVGYRRYTTENRRAKYPFGFGLSYSKFEYSGLSIGSENIELTVKNVGSVDAYEVAQLYVGKKDSAIPRPLKELKGFAKVLIAPGASMRITFPLSSAMLEIFDADSGTRKTEGGKYEVYIGASCTDIKLNGSIDITGTALNKRGSLGEYLAGISQMSDEFKLGDKDSRGFKSARPAEAFSFEQLFSDEFDDDNDVPDAADDEQENEDYSMYIDDGVTAKTLAEWLIAAGKTRGVSIEPSTARELIGAMSASRAVMLGCSEEEFKLLVDVLGAFCGCATAIDDCGSYTSSDELFVNGNDTALTSALGFADSHRDIMTVVALDNVKIDALGEIFVPFIRYATAPEATSVSFGRSKRTVNVAPNIWFVMRLNERASKRCPVYIADMASVIVPRIARTGGGSGVVTSPNYYQFVAACRTTEDGFEIDEPLWKHLDRFESFVASRTAFKIDNKMYVQMEKIISVCLECGAEPNEALDTAVAMKLIPHISHALKSKLTTDDPELAATLGNCFGDDNIGHCMTVLNLFAN